MHFIEWPLLRADFRHAKKDRPPRTYCSPCRYPSDVIYARHIHCALRLPWGTPLTHGRAWRQMLALIRQNSQRPFRRSARISERTRLALALSISFCAGKRSTKFHTDAKLSAERLYVLSQLLLQTSGFPALAVLIPLLAGDFAWRTCSQCRWMCL